MKRGPHQAPAASDQDARKAEARNGRSAAPAAATARKVAMPQIDVPPPDADDPMLHDPRPVHPTDKAMGLVPLVLDKGIRTTLIGVVYGLDFEMTGRDFSAKAFFDHYNRRLKVLDYSAKALRPMVERLCWTADQNGFDKIFLKASREDWQTFLGLGFVLEGILKYYFRGEDAYMMSWYGSLERAQSRHLIEENDIIEAVMRRPRAYEPPPLPEGYHLVRCEEEHIPQLVRLYRQVFRSYPSPLTHPDYIQQTMRRHVIYRAVLAPDGRAASAASAELDEKHGNAELTDCATRHADRGRGLMYSLLHALEQDMAERGLISGYTFARARSAGMNQVFYRLGYEYTGRMVNSCDIAGQMEDMNLWVKALAPEAP